MNNYQSQIANLKTKITQLKQEKEQLRLLLHELIEVFYKINQKQSFVGDQKEPSRNWTFNPDLATLFKNFANFKTNCSHQQTGKFTASDFQPNECHWNQIKDFFAKMKSDTKGDHE